MLKFNKNTHKKILNMISQENNFTFEFSKKIIGDGILENSLVYMASTIANIDISEDQIKNIINLLAKYGYVTPQSCAEAICTNIDFSNANHKNRLILIEYILQTYPIDWKFCTKKILEYLYNHHLQYRLELFFKYGKEKVTDLLFDDGLTLMHKFAINVNNFRSSEREKLLQLLFEYNASPTIRDYDTSRTPYQMARLKGNHGTAEKIKAYTIETYKGKIEPSDTIENQDKELRKERGDNFFQPILSHRNLQAIKFDESSEYLIPRDQISLDESLGMGGFGIVYKGKWQHADVAVKMLRGDFSTDALSSFFKEAELFSKLRHPNIVTMYGLCNTLCAIVMEYMPQGSLFDVLQSKNLGWNKRYEMATDVAMGLQYLHSKNIMHCDIKSKNVLVDIREHCKLSDFGFARIKRESTTNSKSVAEVVGTIPYMAPELLEGNPNTFEADIYSLAMVLWEITFQDIPWKNQTATVIIYSVLNGKRETPPSEDTPPSIAENIKLCWAQNPKERRKIQEVVGSLYENKC